MDKTIVYKVIDADYKSISEKTRTIWHKISSETKDRMGDVVRIDGLDTRNFLKKPAVLYGHSYAGIDPVPVIGAGLGFQKVDKFFYAGTRFLDPEKDKLSDKLAALVNDLWTLNKKNLMGWSIGFIPLETEDLKENGKTVGKDFKKTELLEYSNVIIPANREAVNDAIRKRLISPVIKEFGRGFPAVDEGEHRFMGDEVNLSFEDKEEIKALYEKYLRKRLQIEDLLNKTNKILPVGQRTWFYYRFVDESRIPEYRLQAARSILLYCSHKLGIPKLSIQWIEACRKEDHDDLNSGHPIYGKVGNGDMIFVRRDIPLYDVKFTIAVEAHHLWFGRTYGGKYPLEKEPEMWETTANAFAEIVLHDLAESEREAKADREFLAQVSMARR